MLGQDVLRGGPVCEKCRNRRRPGAREMEAHGARVRRVGAVDQIVAFSRDDRVARVANRTEREKDVAGR